MSSSGWVKNWRHAHIQIHIHAMSNIQIIYMILVFIKNSNSWIWNLVVSREGIYHRSTVLSHWCNAMSAQIRLSANPWITSGAVVAFFGNGRKIRDSATAGRLEEARLDGRRICSQPDRNEIRLVLLVTFSFPPSCLRFETSDSVIDIRAFSRLSCFPRVPSSPLLLDSTFGIPSRHPLFVFPTAFPGRNSLSKKYPWILQIYRHLVSHSGFPFFIVPNSAVIAISAAKRTTSLRGHLSSLVYIIFFSLKLSCCLFVQLSGDWFMVIIPWDKIWKAAVTSLFAQPSLHFVF